MTNITENPTATLADIRAKTEARLRAWLGNATRDAAALDVSYQRLWQGMSDQVMSGGKLLRPCLTVVSYRGFGGTSSAIYDAAAGQELLHVSLLIHDDIMDHDYTRRGQPNLAGQYLKHYEGHPQAAHQALSAALLGGDLLLAGAHEVIATSAFELELKQAAMGILARQMYEVAAGQLLDVESDFHAQSPEHSLKIARLKTAAYSFTGPLLMGAILAEAPIHVQTELETLGNALGIGFQLADDLLGTFGDEAQTGKSMLSDMREGKPTYTIRQAFELATPADRTWLDAHWGQPDIDLTQLQQARDIIERSGAKAKTLELMTKYVEQARAALGQLDFEPAAAAIVHSIINRAVWRQA